MDSKSNPLRFGQRRFPALLTGDVCIVSFALIGPREHFCLPCFATVEKYSYPYNLFLQTRGENAPWSLAIKHFTDIRESKGQWL